MRRSTPTTRAAGFSPRGLCATRFHRKGWIAAACHWFRRAGTHQCGRCVRPAADRSILVGVLVSVAVLLGGVGCVRRTVKITTEPPHALVYLNDQEVGRSTVTTDFLWYGDYDVVIRQDGYRTLHTNWDIKPPWYEVIPLDFFFEVLWPGRLHDQHARHFILEPAEATSTDDLLDRALATRDRALDPRK